MSTNLNTSTEETQNPQSLKLWRDYVSIDDLMEKHDDETTFLSDGGYGAEKIYAALDEKQTIVQRIKAAREIVRRNAPDCLDVFNAIIRNGSNRKESIWQLMHIWKQRKSGKRRKRNTGKK